MKKIAQDHVLRVTKKKKKDFYFREHLRAHLRDKDSGILFCCGKLSDGEMMICHFITRRSCIFHFLPEEDHLLLK